MSLPPVQHHGVLQPPRKYHRTDVTGDVVDRTVLFLTAWLPNLIAGRTEEEAGSCNHIRCPMVLKVVRVEEKQVREVAAALKQAWERVRKALVCKEGRAAAEHREAEKTLLQLGGIWSCIAQLCDILKLAFLHV